VLLVEEEEEEGADVDNDRDIKEEGV